MFWFTYLHAVHPNKGCQFSSCWLNYYFVIWFVWINFFPRNGFNNPIFIIRVDPGLCCVECVQTKMIYRLYSTLLLWETVLFLLSWILHLCPLLSGKLAPLKQMGCLLYDFESPNFAWFQYCELASMFHAKMIFPLSPVLIRLVVRTNPLFYGRKLSMVIDNNTFC